MKNRKEKDNKKNLRFIYIYDDGSMFFWKEFLKILLWVNQLVKEKMLYFLIIIILKLII